MNPPTSESTYWRARRLANVSLWAIELQCRRLRSTEPEDDTFVFRKWADFDFLIVALTRLRRAAKLAAKLPEIQSELVPAIKDFDSGLPHLKKMRDVAEHIDDYAVDKGRETSVQRYGLEVSSLYDDEEGIALEWLGHALNSDMALTKSRNLFAVIQKASVAFETP